jgi:hypothetical protein
MTIVSGAADLSSVGASMVLSGVLTVLLPTVRRSDMLRGALQSIADQTACHRISRVVVSENGGDRGSQAVCAEFPQLPITYLFQEPQLGPLEHAQLLMREHLTTDFTAILHDDDWWEPHHVAEGLAALYAHPDATVYGANLTLHENGQLLSHLTCNTMAWFAAGYPPPMPLWLLTPTNVLLASLINFIIHYSSMIMRTEALREAAYVYTLGNPYDNDRMLIYALSRRGPVVFNPKPSVVVRTHANRETARFAQDERNRRMASTTVWMVESGLKPWPVVAAAFAQRLAACPEGELKIQYLRDAVTRPWCLPELARHLDRAKDRAFFDMYDRAREAFAGEKPPEDR